MNFRPYHHYFSLSTAFGIDLFCYFNDLRFITRLFNSRNLKKTFLILQCTIHHSSVLFSFREIVYFLKFLVLSHCGLIEYMMLLHYLWFCIITNHYYGFVETLFLSYTWCALEKVTWATRRTRISFVFLSEFYTLCSFFPSPVHVSFGIQLYVCVCFSLELLGTTVSSR